MSYMGRQTITRKQCNVLYGAFKRGELTPPRDCRGKVKRPGFVYGFEGMGRYEGMFLKPDEMLWNGQWRTVQRCVELVCSGDLESAQRLLDGGDAEFVERCFPEGTDPRKMWKGR